MKWESQYGDGGDVAGFDVAPEEDELTPFEGDMWGEVLKRIYATMTFNNKGPASAADLLASNTAMQNLVVSIRRNVEELLSLAVFLNEDSEIYAKIKKTRDKLIAEQGLTPGVAAAAAWKIRKDLVIEMVETNIDVLQSRINAK
jgi:hypothetical protein